MHSNDAIGPWPAFVDLLAATALLFLVLFAVITVPQIRKAKEAGDVKTTIDTLYGRFSSALKDKHVEVNRRANFLFIRIEGDATFPQSMSDMSALKSEGKEILRGVANVVIDRKMMNEVFQFQIVGHASSEGNSTKNWTLSAARAAAVAQFLVDTLKLDACKVSAVGRSNYYPVDPKARATIADPRDRRIEVEVLPRFAADSVQSRLLQNCRSR